MFWWSWSWHQISNPFTSELWWNLWLKHFQASASSCSWGSIWQKEMRTAMLFVIDTSQGVCTYQGFSFHANRSLTGIKLCQISSSILLLLMFPIAVEPERKITRKVRWRGKLEKPAPVTYLKTWEASKLRACPTDVGGGSAYRRLERLRDHYFRPTRIIRLSLLACNFLWLILSQISDQYGICPVL